MNDKIYLFEVGDNLYVTAQQTQFDAEALFDSEFGEDYMVREIMVDEIPEEAIQF